MNCAGQSGRTAGFDISMSCSMYQVQWTNQGVTGTGNEVDVAHTGANMQTIYL